MDAHNWIGELSSHDVAARRGAAEALSRAGADSAVLPLLGACSDPDEQVREWAHAALEALGPPPRDIAPRLAETLDQPGSTGYWSATLLGRLREDAAPWAGALGQACGKNPDLAVRQRAVWALGQIGPAARDAIPALEAASQDADARLAKLSREALQKIKLGS